VALIPFALDAYLPAFPDIARDLGVSSSEVGLTLSVYVFLLALGQLVGGPLSDRFGRRPILFAGIAIFIAGSLLVTTAQTLPTMLIWRALQAFGGGWVAVSVPAIVRDRTSGAETARLFSLIALIMFLAPALAPSIGSLLMSVMGWRGIFEFLALYAMLVALLLYLFLFRREAPAALRRPQPLHALVTNYRHVLAHGTAMMLVLLQALLFSVLLIYLTHVPFLLQDWLGLDNRGFSAVFALNVGAMAGIALLNRLLLRHFEPRQILAVAVRFQCAAVAALLAVTLLPVPRWLLIPAMMLIVASMGAISPNVQGSVMQFFRELGGTAAALLGAVQFAGGGLVSAASALVVQGEASRVAGSMLACSLLAAIVMFPVGRRLRVHRPAPDPGL
jgi:DHA1 family bicyclomycin/chloramphenicol resistance-like MFS transporter